MAKDGMSRSCEVVVIGGSAGSLEVVLRMLERLRNNRMPVIVVLHRKNSSESMLTEVISGRSAIPAKEAEEKEPIRPGWAYLAPADYHLLVENDRTFSFEYSEKVNFSRPSIDVSFESVAAVYGPGTVGILLSGGNADGVNGLRAIKRAGGFTVVQDPGSAEIAFMPESAVAGDVVDLILPAEGFAAFLNELK